MIEGMELAKGIENGLVAKLYSGLGKLEDGNEKNDGAAKNSLEAFINYIKALRGKKIDEALASSYYPHIRNVTQLNNKWLEYMQTQSFNQ